MAGATAVGTRCSRCSAAVRAGAPWCTQCYLDLRVPVGVPAERPAASGSGSPVPAPPDPGPGSGWPCGACGVRNALDADCCAGCGLGFLADLRLSDTPAVVLPLVGDLLRMGRGQRAAAALGLVLAAVLLTGLLGLLLS